MGHADIGSWVSGQWVMWRRKRSLFVWEEVFNELEATRGGVGQNLVGGSDGVDLVVRKMLRGSRLVLVLNIWFCFYMFNLVIWFS
ncbi:hypothetical protein MtrunA17_Chr1g0147411 [Medicago truncatula]|uniref:Transmembrane protein n=1 Tax=Medicago truncatula TaxID=3880 RepID=A0A396JKE6_MEDTR|nr:hypothetical protein MtrunA17_Chr1g0147411 [Medicago truncatula]